MPSRSAKAGSKAKPRAGGRAIAKPKKPTGKKAVRPSRDIMSPEKRSALMSRIRGKNTGPERLVAEMLEVLEVTYESHCRDLPGRPDFVFREIKLAVFVDGDFWHGWRFPLWQHKLTGKWGEKIERNRRRDLRNHARLRRMGWRVLRLWEHKVNGNPEHCSSLLQSALEFSVANAPLRKRSL
jgi:DNA mismatch endonuclease (patch repair protein)